jgi:hypothetical protein
MHSHDTFLCFQLPFIQKGDKGEFMTEQKTYYLKIRCVVTKKGRYSNMTPDRKKRLRL